MTDVYRVTLGGRRYKLVPYPNDEEGVGEEDGEHIARILANHPNVLSWELNHSTLVCPKWTDRYRPGDIAYFRQMNGRWVRLFGWGGYTWSHLKICRDE